MEEILYQKISVYSEFFFPWKVSSLCLTQRQKKKKTKKKQQLSRKLLHHKIFSAAKADAVSIHY